MFRLSPLPFVTAALAASLSLGAAVAGPPAKPAGNQPAAVASKPCLPVATKPTGPIVVRTPVKNPFGQPAGAASARIMRPVVLPQTYQPTASFGGYASNQFRPDPPLINVFWWPLRVGPNNDPNWVHGLTNTELQKELDNTMARLEELGGPGIWNACKEYNDWQRHRELILDEMRARRAKK